MKPSKSVNSLSATSQQQQQQQQQQQMMNGNSSRPTQPEPKSNGSQPQQLSGSSRNSAPTSPICRCRVMYLGSSVPHETKDGLQGIQQPLRELYPDRANLSLGSAGIDSWLSVWSNGILIENVDETGREMKKFFKIEALHYCAAVKFVPQAAQLMGSIITSNEAATLAHSLASASPKFLPLDSPHARLQQDNNTSPPIFASILRRTTGVKVLECHAFICRREAAANALVRCCFHAYADTMYAKQIGAEIDNSALGASDRLSANHHIDDDYSSKQSNGAPAIAARRSKSIAALNDVADSATASGGEFSDSNQHNHHQQQQQQQKKRQDFQGAVLRRRSLNNGQQQLNFANSGGDMSDASQQQQHHQAGYDSASSLQSQKYNSKSMHHLNYAHLDQSFNNFLHQGGGHLNRPSIQSTSYHNLVGNKFENSCEPSALFPRNPCAGRVPSYPPQNIIDQQQLQQQMQMQLQLQAINGGTLRSVKSMAANSIASTLLRSKKHAKAMSMAQLSTQQQNLFIQPPVTSFHQHPHQAPDGSLFGGSFMTLPPVPPMFLPSVPRHINGSQTMKLPSRHQLMPQMGPAMPVNFEAMTPKEMKKLLKKSAKYGLDPSKFVDTGLALMPPQHMSMPMAMSPEMNQAATFGPSAGATYNSMPAHDMPDLAYPFAPPPPPPILLPPPPPLSEHLIEHPNGGPPIKSILVKPNPEFLKSKAGKKWLKQQKEFKKLLPSHLDGLPIVFGPPPMDMLDPADGHPAGPNSSASSTVSSKTSQQRPSFVHAPSQLPQPPPPPPTSAGQLPLLDSNGFYTTHPLYGLSGRASAASTILRNSPQVMQQQLQENHHHLMMMQQQQQQQQRNHQSMYSNPILMSGGQQQYHPPPPPPPPPAPPMLPPHFQQACDDLYGDRPAYDPRQFVTSSASSSSRRRRNHMVEQSVISLGDEENEDDDHDDERANENNGLYGDENHIVGHSTTNTNGYYSQVENQTQDAARHRHRRRRNSSSGEQQQQQQTHDMCSEHMTRYQDDQEQIVNHQHQQMANQDQNRSSSGIYRRRGHINERAFSYSIRQEADNSDAEYRNGELSDSNYHSNNNNNINPINNNNNHPKYRLNQQQQMQMQIQMQQQQQRQDMPHYDNPQGSNYQDRPPIQYYKQHHQQQQVDDLSNRLENQLNMKSFANSGVKSHM